MGSHNTHLESETLEVKLPYCFTFTDNKPWAISIICKTTPTLWLHGGKPQANWIHTLK